MGRISVSFMLPIRVAVAIEQPVFRYGLTQLLRGVEGICIATVQEHCSAAIDSVMQTPFDVLVTDADPGDVACAIRATALKLSCRVRLIGLVDEWSDNEQAPTSSFGACTLSKRCSAHELIKAVRVIGADVLAVGRDSELNNERSARTHRFGLTRREMEVVAAVVEGGTNAQIGLQLGISEETVRHHLTNIFDKVGTSTRLELAVFALGRGLVTMNQGRAVIAAAGPGS